LILSSKKPINEVNTLQTYFLVTYLVGNLSFAPQLKVETPFGNEVTRRLFDFIKPVNKVKLYLLTTVVTSSVALQRKGQSNRG
jgi:hypothetical protein